jgi:hypothetical protein
MTNTPDNSLKQKSDDKQRILFPAVAAAFALFAGANFWFGATHPLADVPVVGIERNEIAGALHALNKLGKPLDVVLLGSSLVSAPAMQYEAESAGQPVRRYKDRQLVGLEKLFAQSGLDQTNVFSLASGGATTTDAYLVVKHILAGQTAPRAIIYGVSPREFHDNRVPGIDSTETFRLIGTTEDFLTLADTSKLSFDKIADVVLHRTLPLASYSADLRNYCSWRTKKWAERLCPGMVFAKYDATGSLKITKAGVLPEESRGDAMAFPGREIEHYPLARTLSEYHSRYNPASMPLMDSGMRSFEKMLAIATAAGTRVYIVNMPLSKTNQNEMPSGFYDSYRRKLASACDKFAVTKIDLCSPQWISEDNRYVDSIHISPQYSELFFAELAEKLKRQRIAEVTGNKSNGTSGRNGSHGLTGL